MSCKKPEAKAIAMGQDRLPRACKPWDGFPGRGLCLLVWGATRRLKGPDACNLFVGLGKIGLAAEVIWLERSMQRGRGESFDGRAGILEEPAS
ncbi:MAG TPA: hypothetical protein GXX40_04705 [Firmicutes bacterium]|nr:hypothetical protein [Bacillota bacterium]